MSFGDRKSFDHLMIVIFIVMLWLFSMYIDNTRLRDATFGMAFGYFTLPMSLDLLHWTANAVDGIGEDKEDAKTGS